MSKKTTKQSNRNVRTIILLQPIVRMILIFLQKVSLKGKKKHFEIFLCAFFKKEMKKD